MEAHKGWSLRLFVFHAVQAVKTWGIYRDRGCTCTCMMAALRDCLKGVSAPQMSFIVLSGFGSNLESLKSAAAPGPQWGRGSSELGQ